MRWCRAALEKPRFISGQWTSAEVALLATAVGLLLTMPAGFASTRRAIPGREAVAQFCR